MPRSRTARAAILLTLAATAPAVAAPAGAASAVAAPAGAASAVLAAPAGATLTGAASVGAGSVGAASVAAVSATEGLASTGEPAIAEGLAPGVGLRRLATFPAYRNSAVGDAAAAEGVAVAGDGRSVVYTDRVGRRLGFVDITEPSRPAPLGTLGVGGVPTSVGRLGHLLVVAVDTGASGRLLVVDERDRAPVREVELGGRPGSVAVAPSGRYVAVALANGLSVVDVRTWAVRRVELAPGEPGQLSINSRDEAVVSLPGVNRFAIVSLGAWRVVRDFAAGTVTVSGVDTVVDGRITLDGTVAAAREPKGVAWLSGEVFAGANGGTRGWTVFTRTGKVVWDAGNTLEHVAVEHGLFPEGAAGIAPANVAFARMGGVPTVFVTAGRGNFTAVYDVSEPRAPRLRQLLPTAAGPAGVVPSRDLLVVAGATENPVANLRGAVQIYGPGRGRFPSVVSDDLIPWGTLSGLSHVPGKAKQLVAVTDAAYTPTRILTVDVRPEPATIVRELTVTKDGRAMGYDAEGVFARRDGGYWLGVEGSATTPNLLVRLDASGAVRQEVPLPADVAAAVTANGIEGVTETGGYVWVAIQRALRTDPAGGTRIGRYDPATGGWAWLTYPLDAAPIGWTGLSELVALDGDTFAVIERDNQRGAQASVKRIYAFDVPATWDGVPAVTKRLVRDLLPALAADGGWVQDKVEGLTVGGDGEAYVVTDNDALQDATGETVLLRLGRLR